MPDSVTKLSPAPPPPDVDGGSTVRYEDGLPTPIHRPADGPSGLLPALHQLLDHVPGFVLDGEIGRGGSGVVFRGRDEVTGEPVAVKILRLADPDEPRELARFVAECEAAAAVDHPNVARLHSYGEHQGRPYLVLEYCGGGSLAQQLRRDGPLTPAAAAELIAQVADGVHAVHLAGIVHRDVKPGNILFGTEARSEERGAGRSNDTEFSLDPRSSLMAPKIADFGLAKRQSSNSDLTRTRAVLGSPAYMSPEQARGGTKFVGPGADVWALGVVLFECLAGVPPFTGPDAMAVLRKGADAPPPPLRRLASEVPSDLALVVDKCLRKEPTDRYPTAAALAADLRAVLAGRPVTARGQGVGRRLGEWARRHPTAATLAVCLVVSLVGGTGVASWLAVKYRRQELATRAALDRVTAERRATWDALNNLTDESLERLMARQPTLSPDDRRFLERVVAQYEQAVARQADAPDARQQLAHGQFRVARLRHRLGDTTAAEAGYRAGADGFRQALAADPTDADAAAGLAGCQEPLGWLLATAGRLSEGEAAAREAVEITRSLGDPIRLGKARATLGLVLARADLRAEAVTEYRRSLDDLLPTAASNRRQVAQTRVNLATVLALDPDQVDTAEAEYQSAVAEYDRLLAADPAAPRDRLAAVRARTNFGKLHAQQDEWAEAVDQYKASLDIARPLVEELPGYPDHQHELARTQTLWAAADMATGDTASARRRLTDAAGHHRRAVQAKPDGLIYKAAYAENRRLLAEVALARGDYATAGKVAIQFAELSPGPQRSATAAGLLARAAKLVMWDAKLPPTERLAAAAKYTADAARLPSAR